MNISIRPMTEADREPVIAMMRTFYASPALLTDGSEEIFRANVSQCVSGSPYLQGYVFRSGEAVWGYAMVARSFSTEFGRPCLWIEDLYLRPEARSQGLGGRFLEFVRAQDPQAVLRLEAEAENAGAIALYERHGFRDFPYKELLCL